MGDCGIRAKAGSVDDRTPEVRNGLRHRNPKVEARGCVPRSNVSLPFSPSGGNAEQCGASGHASIISIFSSLFTRLSKRHNAFVNYQRQLHFRTVVPEPPHTFRENISALLYLFWGKVGLIIFFLFTWPFLLALHILLHFLDRQQRLKWLSFQHQWPFASVPHVRPVRYEADEEYPLDRWHLRCEDGRQQWIYGYPLCASEEGNELGLAQSAGLESVAALREQQQHGDVKVVTNIVQEKWRHRQELQRYHLGLAPTSSPRKRPSPEEAMRDGADFLVRLQDPFSGHWPNDYSGCMFLTPGVVFTKFIIAHGDVRRMFPPIVDHHHVRPRGGSEGASGVAGLNEPHEGGGTEDVPCNCGEAMRRELIRYLRNYQNYDGGWGQHTEGHSTMLGTVLNYVSMRMLGVAADDPQLTEARSWIHTEGGATLIPMWGKVWLCILGLFSWDGVNPLPPEMLLLPDWMPFSLGRSWCHSRVIAIPFSYFYGLRWSAPSHPLLESLKGELYLQPFDTIAWHACRNTVSSKDLFAPTSKVFRMVCALLDWYERRPIRHVRRFALERCWQHIAYDDENTNFICLGPVNKSLNMLATWLREGNMSVRYQSHVNRVNDYFYMGAAGMSMSGYNGSQLWDTSFAIQALCACKLEMLYPQAMALGHHYINVSQVQEDPIAAEKFYRHRTKGAWNFSTSSQGWQVSDCTAEGLRVVLLLSYFPFPTTRIFDAVDELLSLRNVRGDCGWASYEPTRSPSYCELMSCAELFKDIMVEYSYAECSSSCVHTLSLFREKYPTYRRREVDNAIREGIACVLGKQRPDGSFYGSWAVCFTYAAWLVADALRISGELADMANHPICCKLVDFLLSHQNGDGGWGEDVNACVRQVWVNNPDGSQVVNTAWAVMAIMSASGEAHQTLASRRARIISAVDRGIQLLMSRQLENGDWKQERISGVFNGNNPIHYPGYKNSMPVWALGQYVSWKGRYISHE